MDTQERNVRGAAPSAPDTKFTIPVYGPTEGNVVYELRAEDGTPLYVGSTKNLRARISAHKREWIKWHRAHGRGEVSAHSYGPYKTLLEARKEQNERIYRLRPVRNRIAVMWDRTLYY